MHDRALRSSHVVICVNLGLFLRFSVPHQKIDKLDPDQVDLFPVLSSRRSYGSWAIHTRTHSPRNPGIVNQARNTDFAVLAILEKISYW